MNLIKNDSLSIIDDSVLQGSNNNSFRNIPNQSIVRQPSSKKMKFLRLPTKKSMAQNKGHLKRRSMHDRMARSVHVDMGEESMDGDLNNPRKMSMFIDNIFNLIK